MKRSPVAFVLVPVVLGLALPVFGRNTTDQDVARALRRALLARNLSDTAEIKVSNAVAAGKDVCIEYRAISSGQSISGQAVYRGDQDLVFLDNSWIWERTCLSGKYGQRRTGKDLTQALNAVLTEPRPAMVVAKSTTRIEPVQPAAVASVPPVQPASLVVVTSTPVPSAPVQIVPQTVAISAVPPAAARTMAPMPNPVPPPVAVAAVPRSTPVVTAASVTPAPPTAAALPVIERVAAVPPVVAPSVRTEPEDEAARVVASAPAPKPEPVSVPVVAIAMPAPIPAPQPSVPAASPVIATAPVVAAVPQVAHVPAANAIPAVATVTQPAQIATASANRAASEVTPLHGVTIIDDNGALGTPTGAVSNSAPQESLADAARRARIKRSME